MTLVAIEGTQTGAPIDPGKKWMDDNGVVHIRGKIHASFAEGYDEFGVPWAAVGVVEEGQANFPHGTGDFAGWKVAKVTFSRGWTEPVTVMEGFFHIPPGGGGEKSAPLDEPNTWGSVKALFR